DTEPVGLQGSVTQLGDGRLDGIQRRQHVRAVGAEYLNAERRVAVLVSEELARRRRDIQHGDVRQTHPPAVAPGEHQGAELLGAEAPGEAQRVLPPTDVELS